jgi:hypothetical protein
MESGAEAAPSVRGLEQDEEGLTPTMESGVEVARP